MMAAYGLHVARAAGAVMPPETFQAKTFHACSSREPVPDMDATGMVVPRSSVARETD